MKIAAKHILLIASAAAFTFFPELSMVAQTNAPTGANSVPDPTAIVNPVPVIPGGTVVNYMRTWEPQQPFTTQAAVTSNTQVQQVRMVTQYIDGFGRPMQSVSRQLSPGMTDMVTATDYAPFGMEQFKYLPYTSPGSDGSFKTNAFAEQNTFYSSTYPAEQPAYHGEQFYYSYADIEASPLNRVKRTFAPGNSWAGSADGNSERSVRAQYLLNNGNDMVQAWSITSNALTYNNNDVNTNIPTTGTGAVYAALTLYKTVILDERGYAVVEYKDFDGRLILKKVQSATSVPSDYSGYPGFLSTYYVYDDIGQLRFVIPPKAVAEMIATGSFALTAGMINELAFRYEYDNRQRQIAKKAPGAAWTYMIYDQRDRPVFMQDANMRPNNQWLTTLYDAQDRPIITGMTTGSIDPGSLQQTVNTLTTPPASNPNSSLQSDITLQGTLTGTYTVTNSITMIPDLQGDGASGDIIAQIAPGGADGVTTYVQGAAVNFYPIPSGFSFIPLTTTSYDNYSATSKHYDNSNNSHLDQGANAYADPLPAQGTIMTRGLVTSSTVRVIENASNLAQGAWLENASFYDDKGRVIQVQHDNYKNGLDVATNLYNFGATVLCTYEVHNNPAAGTSNFRVKTNFNYDHAGRLLTVKKNLNDDANASALATTQRTIATYTYDALGRMKEKQVGQRSISGSALSASPLEDQSYSYNIRGWLKGINWNYPASGPTNSQVNSATKWFGMDLSYDWGFGSNQFNGSIAGQRWVSGADGQERSYGFGYDVAGRLLFGDFSQNFGGAWSKSDPANANFNIDFSEKVGNGLVTGSNYDENGNIRQLQRNGLVINASPPIDNLSYTYENGDVSNKLKAVGDNAVQPAGVVLGDFIDKSTAAEDYGYDPNGNQVTDLNKRLNGSTGVDLASGGAIVYNYLNLPYQITMRNDDVGATLKGTITYIYDAAGNKLEKRVSEAAATYNNNTAKSTTDSYLHGFIYENNSLQYLGMEEGRIRPVTPATYNNGQLFAYDYFLRDHLNNVRTILTDELQQDIYPAATVEAVNPLSVTSSDPLFYEQQFYTIDLNYIVASSSVSGLTTGPNAAQNTYPNNNGNPPVNNNPNCSNTSSPFTQLMNSTYVYRVNGSSNKTGLGVTLRVMAGDKIDIFGNSYYFTNAPSDPGGNAKIFATDLLTNLLGGPTGNVVTHGATVGNISSNTIDAVTPLNAFANKTQSGTIPDAYINYVIFSDQFKYLGGGSSLVGDNSKVRKDHHLDLQNIPIAQNGYVYVYVSNQSPVDVYFDNLQVIRSRGPLMQVENYYPTGLEMAGISGQAAAKLEVKYKYTGKELQHQEFSDETGLEEYDMAARYYDPQLGRWNTQDPAGQYASPYLGMGNNWPNGMDPDGKAFGYDDAIAAAVGGTVNLIMNWNRLHGSLFQRVVEGEAYFAAGAIGGDLVYNTGGLGFLVGGTLNVGVDWGNGQFNGMGGGELWQSIGQSFATGGTSALAGGEAAAKVDASLFNDEGAYLADASNKQITEEAAKNLVSNDFARVFPHASSFAKFIATGADWKVAIYHGVTGLLNAFGTDQFNFTNKSDNLGMNVLGAFGGGFIGSLAADKLWDDNKIFNAGIAGKIGYNFLKGSVNNALSNLSGNLITNLADRPFTQIGIRDVFNGFEQSYPDLSTGIGYALPYILVRF